MLSVQILGVAMKLQPPAVWVIFGAGLQQKGKFCSGWRLRSPGRGGSGSAQRSLKAADPGGGVTAAMGACRCPWPRCSGQPRSPGGGQQAQGGSAAAPAAYRGAQTLP